MRPDEFTRHTVLAVEPTVKLTAVDVVLAPPLSVAVAVAECVPLTSPVALKLYGEEVSVFTTAPSTRNTTLAIVPFESLAVAASGTAAPEAKLWFAVGLVRLTVGAGLLPPPTVNVTAVEVVLAPPLSVAVAVAECVPVARPVALKLYGEDVSVLTTFPSTRNTTLAPAWSASSLWPAPFPKTNSSRRRAGC
jgi:hypothetical protein